MLVDSYFYIHVSHLLDFDIDDMVPFDTCKILFLLNDISLLKTLLTLENKIFNILFYFKFHFPFFNLFFISFCVLLLHFQIFVKKLGEKKKTISNALNQSHSLSFALFSHTPRIMLTGVFKEIVNKQFQESIDTNFMDNIKGKY